MKTFLLLFTLLGTLAQADKLVTFSCKTNGPLDVKDPVKIDFTVQVTSKGDFLYAGNSDDTFKVTPKDSQMGELNENGKITQDKDRLGFFGDGDGFVFVYLTLFKNTNYRSGFARVVDGGGGTGNHYATVFCKNNFEAN